MINTRRVESSHGGEVSEYKSIGKGDMVELERETPGQDGIAYRAITVRKRD